jgi:hypothetical protein
VGSDQSDPSLVGVPAEVVTRGHTASFPARGPCVARRHSRTRVAGRRAVRPPRHIASPLSVTVRAKRYKWPTKLDARKGSFDVLIVWALDRFGRSMVGNLQDVLELDRIGIKVISVRESWLDTGGPVRNLLIAVFSWCAEQERTRLVERTKAGMEAARKRGAKIGRPRVRVDLDRARELRSRGRTLREAAAELGIGAATLHRALNTATKGKTR